MASRVILDAMRMMGGCVYYLYELEGDSIGCGHRELAMVRIREISVQHGAQSSEEQARASCSG